MIRRSRFCALLAVVLLAACHQGQRSSALPAAAPQADTAELFAPGVISDGNWQWRITFTPDGRTAYYTVSTAFFPATRQATIMVTHLQPDGTWGAPAVAPFSGTHPDIDPFVSPDGQQLYFSSIRPDGSGARTDLDIFVMQRTPAGWSEPVRLGSEVNSPLDELYPSQSAAGTLYFASGPFGPTPDADWDIYSAARTRDGFASRVALADINTDLPYDATNPTADWEFNPEISRDGRMLVFTSLRPGGYGFGDLYVSHVRNGGWSTPENLGPAVNTAHDEFHPTLSPDGRTLFFARTILTPAPVPSDFYRIPAAAIGARLPSGQDD